MMDTPSRFASSVVLASSLLAQTATQVPATTGSAGPPIASSDQGAAKIEVTTRLVLLNVLVHHHRGNPVGGLSKADFEITDAGRPQTINVFSVNQIPAPGTRPARTLPRNVVTNRPVNQDGVFPSVTVVLIDSYNTKLIDQRHVKPELLKSLNKLVPEDQVAIYALNSKGFAIVHDFTNNAESLTAAVAKMSPQISHELEGTVFDRANTGNARVDAMLDESNLTISNFLTRDRIANTCGALRTLADHLSGIPGRKNLVWITEGVPIELFGSIQRSLDHGNEHFASYVSEAGRALSNANIAVYPVDARGLMPPSSFQASSRPDASMLPRPQPIPGSSNMPTLPTPEPYFVHDESAATMAYLAETTGGKAFHDIAQAVRQAIDDSTVTYTLGYYVGSSDWNNGYHKVKVTVMRSGMNVRTKKGYLAQDKPTPTSLQLEAALNDAVWSPLDSTRLSLTARVDPSPDLPNASRLSFAIEPAEFNLRQEDGRYRGGADVLFMQERKGGQHGAELMKTFHIALTPERYKVLMANDKVLMANGMLLTADVAMQPDTVAIRIIVVDHSSGATGSVTIAVGPEDKSGSNVISPAR